MKYLKYLLGVVALLGVIFIGNGIITPSVSYESEIIVDKSIEEAWAVMSDESKTSEWLKDITKTERVSGERGTVGAVTNYTFTQDGNESIVTETIKSVTPNDHMAMDFVMEGVMNMDYKIAFSERDGTTRIKSSTTTTGDGIFMRSMVSFMKGSMQAQEEENMNNLKQVIAANTTDYFPAPPAVEMVEEVQQVEEPE